MQQGTTELEYKDANNLLRTEYQKQLQRDGDSSPSEALRHLTEISDCAIDKVEFAHFLDKHDPLKSFRSKFCYPKMKDLPCTDKSIVSLDEDCVYFCGHSLGLKPKSADEYMKEQLVNWEKWALFQHFEGRFPAASCDLYGKEATARLVGAKPHEVAIMNGLTVNLHLLLLAFYRPTKQRFKILIEDHAFPSDRYAVMSHLEIHGYPVEEGLLYLKSRPGEHTLRTEDVVRVLREEGDSIAVVLMPGVQFYTGQKFDVATITAAGQARGCIVGWDLAHSIGNVESQLHDWGVDFACWCTYKYLNSGAGCIAGAFVHEKHNNSARPRLRGWWGNREETRFSMREVIDPANGVDSYRLSNPPPFLVALNMASLEIFNETDTPTRCCKQFFLTGYLELLLMRFFSTQSDGRGSGNSALKTTIEILTPRDPQHRGSQLSVMFSINLERVYAELQKRGVVCDLRPPNVMRLVPVPLYNSFHDVWKFMSILKESLAAVERAELN